MNQREDWSERRVLAGNTHCKPADKQKRWAEPHWMAQTVNQSQQPARQGAPRPKSALLLPPNSWLFKFPWPQFYPPKWQMISHCLICEVFLRSKWQTGSDSSLWVIGGNRVIASCPSPTGSCEGYKEAETWPLPESSVCLCWRHRFIYMKQMWISKDDAVEDNGRQQVLSGELVVSSPKVRSNSIIWRPNISQMKQGPLCMRLPQRVMGA